MNKLTMGRCSLMVAAVIATASGTSAQETLKLTVGQKGAWDTSVSDVGNRAGIFKKHGLILDIVYTQGSGETLQPVLAGSVDIGVSVGTMGAISAYAKGAPVRIIGAEATGASDLFWYVKTDSPIKSLKDIDGKTIAYSTNGASTHGVVLAFLKQYNVKAKPVATGSPPSTLTQVMSGQIDVGWALPPFGLDQIDQKQIRVLANGNDAAVFKGQTVRVLIANLQTFQNRRDAVNRYVKAYRETVDYMYSDPGALKVYAEVAGISVEKAKRVRDDFFAKEALNPDRIVGLDIIVKDAVDLKYTAVPLTKEQIAELVQIPPR